MEASSLEFLGKSEVWWNFVPARHSQYVSRKALQHFVKTKQNHEAAKKYPPCFVPPLESHGGNWFQMNPSAILAAAENVECDRKLCEGVTDSRHPGPGARGRLLDVKIATTSAFPKIGSNRFLG